MRKLFVLNFFLISAWGFSQNIFDIARNGTLTDLKELIKTDKNSINTIDEHSFSPLIIACYRKNIEVATFLIENVKDVNYVSNEGTALAALSVNYDKNLVLKLLKHKANPNIKDKSGKTPLIWAVKFRNIELAKILLEFGAEKSLADEMNITAFEYAIKSNNQEMINLLKSQ